MKFWRKAIHYQSLLNSEAASQAALDEGCADPSSHGCIACRHRIITITGVAIVACCLALSLAYIFIQIQLLQTCLEVSSNYSPAFEAVEIQEVDFENEFVQDSPYRGPPTIERERAWARLSNPATIPISRGAMKLLGRKDDVLSQYVMAPAGEDEGYLAWLEVFHQLHCLNFVRQFSWFLQGKYRNETMPHYFTRPQDGPEYWQIHMDHCVETLRLSLMCQADVSPLLIKLNTSYDPPRQEAEFSSRHRCRNFEKIQAWSEEHGVHQQDM